MRPAAALAHFLSLLGQLLSASLPESVIHEILAEEALSPELRSLAGRLKEALADQGSLAAALAGARGVPPWVTALLEGLAADEDGDGSSRAAILESAAALLDAPAPAIEAGRLNSLDWAILALLSDLGVAADRAFGALARTAQSQGRSKVGEALAAAAQSCREGRAPVAAIAAQEALLRRSERAQLVTLVGADRPLAPRLAGLARTARRREAAQAPEPAEAAPAKPREASKVASAAAPEELGESQKGRSVEGLMRDVSRSVSETISKVSERFGISEKPPRVAARSRSEGDDIRAAVAAARADRDAERGGRPKIQVRRSGGSPAPAPEAAGGRIRITSKDEATPPSERPAGTVRKTIGPDWYSDDHEVPTSESTGPTDKTIGPDASSPETEEAASERMTLTRLRAFLLLLEEEPQQAELLAPRVEAGIQRMREELRGSPDPDHQKMSRELDEVELAFGHWKSEQP